MIVFQPVSSQVTQVTRHGNSDRALVKRHDEQILYGRMTERSADVIDSADCVASARGMSVARRSTSLGVALSLRIVFFDV